MADMSEMLKSSGVAELEAQLDSLQVRPVLFHRLWRTGSFGIYTPTRNEWDNKKPEQINSTIDRIVRSDSDLFVEFDDEGIQAQEFATTRFLGLSYLKSLKKKSVEGEVAATGLERMDIGNGRTLGLVILSDHDNTEAPYALTVPDLAHLHQNDKASVSTLTPTS